MRTYVIRETKFTVTRHSSCELRVTVGIARAGYLLVDAVTSNVTVGGRYSNVVDDELEELARRVTDELKSSDAA
jgi:hypothetical protein